MQYIPLKTRILQPPQDDLYAVLDEVLGRIKEGDIIAISSKVVSLHEGHCVTMQGVKKMDLVAQEAELVIPRPYWSSPLTVKHGAFIGAAGVDESNANGHYVLLPKNPFLSAENIYTHIQKQCPMRTFGVIITDSHSAPLRRGALGVAIGWWGFKPTINHVGKPDLFGREMRVEVSNLADALAAGAGIVMGETNECQPVVIIRGAPHVTFVEGNTKKELCVPFADDTFRVLYEAWVSKDARP